MSFIDSLKSLLNLKSDAIRKLTEENDNLKDSVVACRQALAACDGHSFSLERDLLTATQSPEAYYEWVRKQVGDFPYHETYWGIIIEELKAMGIAWDGKSVPESNAFYTDEVSMKKIIPFLTYPADYAVEALAIDCDDYSRWAASDASKIFKIGSVMQVKGNSPYGYHSWNMCIVGEGQYRLFEPNAGLEASGELFKIGDYGYKPDKWK